MWSTGVMTDTTGPELAQHLRIVISRLWPSFGEHDQDDASHRPSPRPRSDDRSTTEQQLVAAEQALVAYTRRIERVLEADPSDVPFVARPHLSDMHQVSEAPGSAVLLRRVSQAAERMAQLLETLGPQDLQIRWRSEHGISILGELAQEALAQVQAQLSTSKSTEISQNIHRAIRPMHIATFASRENSLSSQATNEHVPSALGGEAP